MISKCLNMEFIPSPFTTPNRVLILRIVEETYILSSPQCFDATPIVIATIIAGIPIKIQTNITPTFLSYP